MAKKITCSSLDIIENLSDSTGLSEGYIHRISSDNRDSLDLCENHILRRASKDYKIYIGDTLGHLNTPYHKGKGIDIVSSKDITVLPSSYAEALALALVNESSESECENLLLIKNSYSIFEKSFILGDEPISSFLSELDRVTFFTSLLKLLPERFSVLFLDYDKNGYRSQVIDKSQFLWEAVLGSNSGNTLEASVTLGDKVKPVTLVIQDQHKNTEETSSPE